MKLKKRIILSVTLILTGVLFGSFVVELLLHDKLKELLPGVASLAVFVAAAAGGFLLIVLFVSRMFNPLEYYLNQLESSDFYDMSPKEIEKFNPANYPEIESVAVLFYRILSRMQSNVKTIENICDIEKVEVANSITEQMEKKAQEMIDANAALKRINEKILEDLDMARRVQQNLLPSARNFEMRKEFKVGSQYSAMESLGGDLYDIIRTGRNGYGFLIADVSGHGIAAALITTMVKVSYNANSGWAIDAGNVCTEVNKEMCRLIGDLEYYVTAFYGNINLETGIFNYSCAGHHPVYLYRAKTRTVEELKTVGPIIGAFPNAYFGSATLQLKEEDRLLFYTDGIIEARNEAGEFYGSERLLRYLKQNAALQPKKFIDKLVKELEAFGNGRPHDDDRAILFIEFIGTVDSTGDPDASIHYEARELKVNKAEEAFTRR